jgi:L-rhamnose mutarotase
MASYPHIQEWLRVCDPLQQPLEDRKPGEWWMEIPEIYHSD